MPTEAEEQAALFALLQSGLAELRRMAPPRVAFTVVMWDRGSGLVTGGSSAIGDAPISEVIATLESIASRLRSQGPVSVTMGGVDVTDRHRPQ